MSCVTFSLSGKESLGETGKVIAMSPVDHGFKSWKQLLAEMQVKAAYDRPLRNVHVLVCPRREVKRFAELTTDETSDLWLTAQKVGKQLESYHKASSLTFAIQDGPQAGQTVPHVHIHIIPRKSGDFEKNDEIYDALDVKEKEMKQSLDLDKERKDRSIEEMAEEADEYRKLFQ
ncbi:bifunctional bis(5'-adenosyl)-triphosphatase/adenylylsulfatase FHIT [Solanum pennellii]|uniref:Bis(5'-adenosyl)-triphosphatase n=1 Tax=Solanum pennellii TaxID=28526 RepID=A0ABM1HKV5_SOLPN|nr:bifunctional bis(5'-adenosyl)-triphosphatase/adenylylsulfatase FHIT [Solanum pennellii]